MGGVILPPVPAFYSRAKTIDDLVKPYRRSRARLFDDHQSSAAGRRMKHDVVTDDHMYEKEDFRGFWTAGQEKGTHDIRQPVDIRHIANWSTSPTRRSISTTSSATTCRRVGIIRSVGAPPFRWLRANFEIEFRPSRHRPPDTAEIRRNAPRKEVIEVTVK